MQIRLPAAESLSVLFRPIFLALLAVVPISAQNATTTSAKLASPPSSPTTTLATFVGQWNIGGSSNFSGTANMTQSASLSGGVLSITVSPSPSAAAGGGVTPKSAAGNGGGTKTENGKNSSQQSLAFTILPPLNFVCIALQLYVCLFGRRMRMDGLRWFTLYYNLWNIYQVIIVSNTVVGTPWTNWLADVRFVKNKVPLELLTMSIFPIGVVFLVPFTLLSHFCFCCALRWLPWLPLFVLLTFISAFLFNGGLNFSFPIVKGNGTVSINNGTTAADLVESYAFLSISLAMFSALYLVPLAVAALFFFICYRLLNRYNPNSNHPNRSSRIIDLILLVPFLLIVLIVHLPSFAVNLSVFFMVDVYPLVLPLLAPPPSGNSSSPISGGAVDIMMKLFNYYNQIIQYKDISEMALPLVEFLASFLFIRMFREQWLSLISCYACYKGDKEGAFGVCCCGGKSRTMRKLAKVEAASRSAVGPMIMTVQPPLQQTLMPPMQQGAIRWAQPVVCGH